MPDGCCRGSNAGAPVTGHILCFDVPLRTAARARGRRPGTLDATPGPTRLLALIGDLRVVAVPRTTRNFRSASWERGAGSRRSPLVALSRVMVLDSKRRETLPLGPRHVRAGNIYSVALGSPAARGDLPPPPTVLSKDRADLCPLQTLNDVLAVIDALGCGCEDPRCPAVVAAVLAANKGTERPRSRGRS